MGARDRLAAAHRGMTADEIAEHALDLADVLDSMDEALAAACAASASSRRACEQVAETYNALVLAIRRAQSLLAARRYREGRAMVAELAAAVEPLPAQRLAVPSFDPLSQTWPGAFAPKGN